MHAQGKATSYNYVAIVLNRLGCLPVLDIMCLNLITCYSVCCVCPQDVDESELVQGQCVKVVHACISSISGDSNTTVQHACMGIDGSTCMLGY